MTKPDFYEYIRRTYNVPAYIGMRVEIEGKPGVLVAGRSDAHYLHVLFDEGYVRPQPCHPTDNVRFIVQGIHA